MSTYKTTKFLQRWSFGSSQADNSVPRTLICLLNKQFEKSAHSRPDCEMQQTKRMRGESRNSTHNDRVVAMSSQTSHVVQTHSGDRLVRLASILLQVLFELSSLSVSYLYRSNSSIIRLLELDWTITYIFTIHLFPSFEEIFWI